MERVMASMVRGTKLGFKRELDVALINHTRDSHVGPVFVVSRLPTHQFDL
jgi:hypothetical protein